jgi:hypothetical protein
MTVYSATILRRSILRGAVAPAQRAAGREHDSKGMILLVHTPTDSLSALQRAACVQVH